MKANSRTTTIARSDLYIQDLPLGADEQRKRGFKPRNDVEEWPLDFPIDWGADPYNDGNWCLQLNAWRMMDPLISAFLKRADSSLVWEAFAFAEDWHRYHLAEGRDHKYGWYDMATGIRALRLAFFVDAVNAGILNLSSPQQVIFNHLVDEHAHRLQSDGFISINNHGLFQVAGLNLLCTAAAQRKACRRGREFAKVKFDQIVDQQFTAEGVHTENSPSYHYFVRNMLVKIGALRRIGGSAEKLADIKFISPWLTFPDGRVARVGDSSGRAAPLTCDPANAPCLKDGRCFAVGDFSKSGYVIVRSLPSQEQNSMLFVTGMAHNMTHKHADELSFELFEFGRFIFIDSGKYGYKRDDFRRYVQSAAAHNTINLADRRIGPLDIEVAGSLLHPVEVTGEGFRISGDASRPGLFRHRREIIYDPGRMLTIIDQVKAEEALPFVSSLHLAPDLDPHIAGDGFTVDVDGHTITASVVGEGCTLSKACGQQDPMLGWQSTAYLKMAPTTVVRAICHGRKRTMGWHIAFDN